MTLVFDIENVFLAQLSPDDIEMIAELEEQEKTIIIVQKYVMVDEKTSKKVKCSKEFCRMPKFKKHCSCRFKLFLVRPYTYEILSAIQPFFEIIGSSNLHYKELKQIITFLEDHLNAPIKEHNEEMKIKVLRQKQMLENGIKKNIIFDKIGRFKPKFLECQIYFQLMMSLNNYEYFRQIDEYIENFHIFSSNRKQSHIYLISSNYTRLSAAMY